jgi:hypothetical protein
VFLSTRIFAHHHYYHSPSVPLPSQNMNPTSTNSQNRRGSNSSNNNNQDNQYNSNTMGNPMGNLSDSLAGLSVGNYSGTSSARGPVTQDRNPHGSLSVLNESIGLNWDSSGGNIS